MPWWICLTCVGPSFLLQGPLFTHLGFCRLAFQQGKTTVTDSRCVWHTPVSENFIIYPSYGSQRMCSIESESMRHRIVYRVCLLKKSSCFALKTGLSSSRICHGLKLEVIGMMEGNTQVELGFSYLGESVAMARYCVCDFPEENWNLECEYWMELTDVIDQYERSRMEKKFAYNGIFNFFSFLSKIKDP